MDHFYTREQQLDMLYAKLPKLACQRKCQECCGPIPAHTLEKERVEELAGKPLSYDRATMSCNMLDREGNCTVYPVRPWICRMWGMVKEMACPHGCVPEGGFLSDAQVLDLYRKVEAIAGPPVRPKLPVRLTPR